MSKKNRVKPTHGLNKKGGKIILTDTRSYTESLDYPIFCFRHLIKTHDLDKCDDKEKKQFVSQLVSLSKISWHDVQFAPRHGMGSEKIDRTGVKVPLPSVVTDDVDHLLSLRFDGKKCFLGLRVKSVFHVIAIDRDFTCYNH